MKIYLRLECVAFTQEQKDNISNKLFPVEFPVMPRKGEIIVCHKIENLPRFLEDYFWIVDYVEYKKKNNKYIPIVILDGVL